MYTASFCVNHKVVINGSFHFNQLKNAEMVDFGNHRDGDYSVWRHMYSKAPVTFAQHQATLFDFN